MKQPASVAVASGLLVATLLSHVIAAGAASQRVPESPAFEVASVKPNAAADARGSMGPKPGGRFEAVNATPMILISFAYNMGPDFVDGAPAWVRSERIDVRAKAADPAATVADMRLMLRSLLAERFNLVAREVIQPRDTYSLLPARSDRLGPKLRLVTIDCDALRKDIAAGKAPLPTPPPPTGPVAPCLIRSRLGTVHSGGITMAVLAQVLNQGAERMVIDKTGLGGTYAVELDYRPNSASIDAADSEVLPSLFAALEEQLGLRLVSDRASVPTLVIDKISRPTPD
jgi:uncharacterized protein (TIGR03435 family)